MNIVMDSVQAKAVDTYMIETIGIPSLVLMEKAAMAVAGTIMERVSTKERILCVCARGNNGADGVAVCRILVQHGYCAHCLLLGDESHSTEEMKKQVDIAGNVGVPLFNNVNLSEYTVIVDAMFGIGLSRNVEGVYANIIDEINQSKAQVFAVDVPSGINASTGAVMHCAVKSDVTVTFGVMKTGVLLYPGAEAAGEVILADIGYSENALQSIENPILFFEKKDLRLLPKRPADANKGTFGKVLVIAGSENMSGACYLSAKAAYMSGAGLVKILTAKENREILQTQLPEAILATYTGFSDRELEEQISWATSIVIGPGLGLSEEAKHLVTYVLNNAKVPCVVDADAITMLDEHEHIKLKSNIVITPHLKEMSRFSQVSIKDMKEDLISFAKRSITNSSYVLALKDTRTVVTDGTRTYLNISGNCGMSTGGSGDVLTGIIAAFLAQGMGCFEAACLGVYVHGLAGDTACDRKNKYSLMAGDIVTSLGEVLKG